MLILVLVQAGCATGQTRKIALGMMAGALVGAVVGHEFVHHGQYRQYEARNTYITSAIFALGTGGILSWHYNEMQHQMEEVSAQYARYRLCNPEEMSPALAQKLGASGESASYQLQPARIGKSALTLDDNTKWIFPTFRKRFLPPERAENQVISTRYIWEIVRPGAFVTRSQEPQYFIEEKGK